MRAPIHPREEERLAALRETGLVGGLPDELQQAAVQLASAICGTPIAAVSLVDEDRQWFSAVHGLDCRETPRDVAFCAHTILGDIPLVVGDATLDPRFSDNSLVTGFPNIRFYAGIPLKTLNDPPLGSLCVIDSTPRRISDGQIKSLQVLAGLVAAQLTMYRCNRQIQEQSDQNQLLFERLTKIASQVPGVIYQFRSFPDGTSSFPYASDRIREIYRVTPEQVEHDASPVFEVLHTEDRAKVEASILESLQSLDPWKQEYRVRFDDGSEHWLMGNAVPQREADGSTLWHGFIMDISDRKLVEASLCDSQRIIEEQNSKLSMMADRPHRMVDDVSHEFRTPLAVIKEFASIISDGLAGPVSEDQAKYLQIISGAVVDLNHMVEDLLDSSKLRAGILRIDRRSHKVRDIIEKGRPAILSKASSRSITVAERIDEELPPVFADEEKVRRVISNLMTNAIKFSPEGGTVVLSATCGPGDGEATISVEDRGPGLSPDDIERLFGRFQQTSSARSVEAKGFGLGLSIAQELCRLNLGALSVVSEKGKGSTFSFSLPIDDHATVVRHYFDSIAEIERNDIRLVLLRVTASGGTDSDEPGRFLSSISHPDDLVIPVWNRSEPTNAPFWWVLGCTDSLESWITRFHTARNSQVADNPVDIGSLEIDVCGVWELPSHLKEARKCIDEKVAGRTSHAATHSNY